MMFGTETILKTQHFYSYSAYAATYVAVWFLERRALCELVSLYPTMR